MVQRCQHRLLLQAWHTCKKLRIPLTRVDVDAGSKAEGLGWGGVCCNDSHVVALEADCLVQQGAPIDDSEAVGLARHNCDVLMGAAGVAGGRPGLLLRFACIASTVLFKINNS